MKKIFTWMIAISATLVGCNKELQEEKQDANVSGDKFYIALKVTTPTTRSSTDEEGVTNSNANPDYEVGTAIESNISYIDLVLVNEAGKSVVKHVEPSKSHNNLYVTEFDEWAGMAEPPGKYKVYIYANITSPVRDGIDFFDRDHICSLSVDNLTGDNCFLMTNADAAKEVTFPEDMSLYSSEATPYNLGTHRVERLVARFDYKAAKTGNVYTLDDGITVTLTQAALINQSKDFYTLRRVSPCGMECISVDGVRVPVWEIGGVETPENYVVCAHYWEKISGYNRLVSQDKIDELISFYDYHMTSDAATWDWKDLPTSSSYVKWQYCKENTIPEVDYPLEVKWQDKGLATAIVFKGKIETTNVTVKDAMDNQEPIYAFENKLYGAWDDVVTASKQADAPGTLRVAVGVIQALTNPTNDDYADNGFTCYTPESDGCYYTYYYYYNRHNDNLDNYKMGLMEFAVVRNNVYKIYVDSINRLGHPYPGGIDPDEEDPYEDCESHNYYFNVTTEVLPWVVRENKVAF